MQLCGWILRTFTTRETLPMLTLYKSLVIPHLDYCSQLWNPHSAGAITKLETVQRNFLKKIRNNHKLSYWDQLRHLKLFSLQRRRERYRIIYIWKILEERAPTVGEIKAMNHIRTGRYCYIPSIKSTAPARIKTLRYASFPIHAAQLFNSLPEDIRNLTGCSIEVFKSQLDGYLRTIPDEPQITGYTASRRASSNSILHMRHLSHNVKL